MSGLLDYSTLQTFILGYLVDYTYPVLAFTVLVAAIGLPLPTSLVILTAAALAGQGDASISVVVLITAFFAALGDGISYALGSTIMRYIDRVPFISKDSISKGSKAFEKNADTAIFFSRFLFTPIGTPVNVLSAAYNVRFGRFIAIAFGGELLWGLELGFVGYFVGTYVEELYDLIANLSLALVLLLGLIWLAKKAR